MRFDETPIEGGGGGWLPEKPSRLPLFLRPAFWKGFWEGITLAPLLFVVLVLAWVNNHVHPRPYKEHRKVP